jgi:hypothetical protein
MAKKILQKKKGKKAAKGKGKKKTYAKLQGGWAYPTAVRSTGTQGFPQMKAPKMGRGIMACCKFANPFDPGCKGCKLPDGQNGRSIPIQVRGVSDYTVGATGNAFISFMGNPSNGQVAVNTVSAGSYTIPTPYQANQVPTVFSGNVGKWRVVCWGVHVTVTSGVTNTSGKMVVNTLESVVPDGGSYKQGMMDGVESEIVPLATGVSFVWIAKRIGPPVWNVGAPLNSVATTQGGDQYNQWTNLVLDIGAATISATTLSVEYVYNLEFQLSGTSGSVGQGLMHLAPIDPPASSAMMDGIQHVQREMPHLITGPLDKVGDVVKQAGMKLAEQGGDYILESIAALFI